MQNFGEIHGLMAMINHQVHHEAQNFEQFASNHRSTSTKVRKMDLIFSVFSAFFLEGDFHGALKN